MEKTKERNDTGHGSQSVKTGESPDVKVYTRNSANNQFPGYMTRMFLSYLPFFFPFFPSFSASPFTRVQDSYEPNLPPPPFFSPSRDALFIPFFFKDLVKLFEGKGSSSSGNNSPRFSKLFRGNKRRGWLTLSWYNFPKKYLHGDELQFNDEVGNNFYYDASSCNFIVGIISSLSSEIGFKTNLYKYLYSTNVSAIIFNKGNILIGGFSPKKWWTRSQIGFQSYSGERGTIPGRGIRISPSR